MFSHRTAVKTIVSGLSFLLVVLLGSCADTMRNEQLARVAKDWSQVVRASQVIPVYPLTEDLVPGDMFLVRMSIPQQHREYQKRGFLPMDMHLGRLNGLEYDVVYQKSHGTRGNNKKIPYNWIFPPDGNAPTTLDELHSIQEVSDGTDSNEPQQRRHMDPTLWPTAPRAAFPSYTFQVSADKGIQVALPIKGIPVALSMMQTDKATGSVTLSDAYTYGVPYDKLIEKVSEWAEDNNHRLTIMKIRRGVNEPNSRFIWLLDFIKRYFMGNKNERTVYLRVISRVYVVDSVSVAILNAQEGAANAKVGAANSYLQEALENVNANLGGTVKLQWATTQSVALDETFPRPLVIGYLGFDFPIDNSGFLQCPIATQYQVESVGGSNRVTMPMATPESRRIARWLKQNPEAHELKLDNWLKGQNIRKTADKWIYSEDTRQEKLESAVKELKIPK